MMDPGPIIRLGNWIIAALAAVALIDLAMTLAGVPR